MKRFSEQLKKQADSLRLSGAERRDLKSRIVSYMEYHPLPDALRTEIPASEPAMVHRFGFAVLHNFYIRRAAGAFVIVLLAGVPFIAERSVPGDVLYPVKVRFNEEVKSTLVRSPYEQVVWETERLERRLAEARVLASEGKLTPEVEAEVAAAVKQHSVAAQESIANIRENDSDGAAIAEIAFSSALDVQSEMLEGRSDTLAGAVDAALEVAVASQQNSRPSYEKLLARIELESTNAYELFNTVAAQATHDEQQDIKKRLEDIQKNVASAKQLQETDTDAAVTELSAALADMRKVISFMTDIDVRENVSIEELVPVELTDEERTALAGERLQEVSAMEADILARLDGVDANTRAAVESRLVEMNAQREVASSSLAAGDLNTADTASLAAHTIAAELVTVLNEYYEEIGGSEETAATSTGTTVSENNDKGTVDIGENATTT